MALKPKFKEVQKILGDFRLAYTPKAKLQVIKNIRKQFPEIADRLLKIVEEKTESAR